MQYVCGEYFSRSTSRHYQYVFFLSIGCLGLYTAFCAIDHENIFTCHKQKKVLAVCAGDIEARRGNFHNWQDKQMLEGIIFWLFGLLPV
jgi:hypothetical protein